MADAFPLAWPATWPRTNYPERSRFRVTPAQARDEMLDQLSLLGATNIVISTNIELRRDGYPTAKAMRSTPEDPGVAVYFEYGGAQRCIPCDRWDTIPDNMRAIGLTVAALRGLDRWGAKHMVDAAFTGFAALPAGGTACEAWWDVLGVPRAANLAHITARYRMLALDVHPDHGGTDEQMARINDAYQAAKREVES